MANMTRGLIVRLDPRDDVATAIADLSAGIELIIRDSHSSAMEHAGFTLATDVPFGHKVALRSRKAGDPIIRYGWPIGIATRTLVPGEHVHIHNLRSLLSPPGESESDLGGKPDVAVVVDAELLRGTVIECLHAGGAGRGPAESTADALVEAHLRGVETHGLCRLELLLARLKAGGINGAAEPLVKRNGAILKVDAGGGLGHHAAKCAALAVAEAAHEPGIAAGWVVNSNHFGFAGHYAVLIAKTGCLGLVTSNGQAVVTAPGGRRPIFSNDPVALAAPRGVGTFVEFDMALSATSRANIARAAKEGRAIAEGIAVDHNGRATTVAAEALTGSLLPFGGGRGFGLLFAVEMLTGLMSGGLYADLVRSKEASATAPEGTVHFLLAIDIERVLGRDVFVERLDELVSRLTGLDRNPHSETPRPPGARRWALRGERLANGVPLSQADWSALLAAANALNVPIPQHMEPVQ